ncbi:xanthine dehydrogenase-like [Ostrinia furnacalis]|uniref:xanthine dehydrogenase-like n=1 Tax=Ostrinia furnacalis TaxID=93504 RepID=UPI00103C1780|nr:xanthine dehydrogenase-like [Ostrinia furnacalis]XP_028167402.1 xanthine dehydrogenase-like [Ostrinia furnacalis]
MDRIYFTVNGVKCYVGCEVSSHVTLLDYLRDYLELRGTKYMCREGGCGACIVSVVKTPGAAPTSVNACLVSITSCYNWDITTIEKIGNRHDGYHPIQKTLAEYNGSQCGYCSPGWVMALYSLLQSKNNLTMFEIEQSFGSNVCRCTGYRPILDAFKKFAKDAPKRINLEDIEDMPKCKKNGSPCTKKCTDEDDWCVITKEDYPNILEIDLKDGKCWFRVSTIRDIFEVFKRRGVESYMLVAGNTAKGAYPIDDYPSTLIDISGVSELKGWQKDQNLVVNAGTTLSELLDIFQAASTDDDFTYMSAFYDHLRLVAHIPVRNIGTIAGNLMIKHKHNEFPSDLFLLFETVGAQLTICPRRGFKKTVTMQDFLKTDMKGSVILNVLLPPLNKEYRVKTYKIMPRAQNAHAIVNAGFLYRIRPSDNILRQCRIVYSGLQSPYTRATLTEKYLFGKKIFTNETLQAALNILSHELVAVENPPEPSPAYRKQLALGLFYKSLLALCPESILNPLYKSGATKIHETRPVSDGRQIFDTNPSLWPLTKPLQKVEALIQCAGEAPYTEDLPAFPHEVFASFVLSTEGSGTIINIDPSRALSEPGVIAFYSAKDIPGLNSFTPADSVLYSSNEEVLCSGAIQYYNQPIGIIVADSRHLADRAAKMVHATYKNVKKSILDVKEAKKDPDRLTQFASNEATNTGTDIAKTFKGENTIYSQYHFTMETLVCVTRPVEDGVEVHSATQWMDGTQIMISRALNLDSNSIDVYVRRLGGAYGIKISRSTQLAIASSLVAVKLNRPVRFIQALTTNMRAVGKRLPCSTDFEVSVNKSGVIQHVDYKFYSDQGYKINETFYLLMTDLYYNLYDSSRWTFKGYNVLTDTHKNTWCRAPGTLEAVAMAENILERISYELDLDPAEVRIANVDTTTHNDIIEMYQTLKSKSDLTERRAAVQKFNTENRWKKRGLRVAFMRWTPVGGLILDVNLSVYHGDGTVAITHSGIEMGQGINTKAIQIAAYFLKIPVEKIKIKGNNTIIGPNAFISGGSLASQNVGIGVQRACEELNARLAPVKEATPNATWEEIITAAYNQGIDLQSHGFVNSSDAQNYNIYGVCFAEVEVDILTGEHEVLRVDLLEDVGRTVNPEVDVGQIEGSFVMALGYWTSENVVRDLTTGEILTNRTWNYHVPQAKDIPRDFRVYLRKNSYSNDTILGTKSVGEPPACLANVITYALREAITSARYDMKIPKTQYFEIDGSWTLDKICMYSETKFENFKFT